MTHLSGVTYITNLETHIRNKLSFDPLYHHPAHLKDINNIISDMKEMYVDAIEDLHLGMI